MRPPPIRLTRALALSLMLTLAPGLAPQAARAADPFKDLADLVPRIKSLLEQKNATSVSIGQIDGPAAQKATGGPGVAKFLADGLAKLNIKVDVTANIGISGKFRSSDDPATKLKIVVLKLEVEDRDGSVLDRIERTINDQSAIAILLGLTVAPPPGNEKTKPEIKAARDQAIRLAIANPAKETNVHDTRISAGDRKDLAVEILVKTGGTFSSRAPQSINGAAFVPLKKTDVVVIKLINESDNSVAVSLHLDGLSMFAISESKNYTHVVVGPKNAAVIRGWHVNNKQSKEFRITGVDEGLAAQLKSKAPVGTITVCFHATSVALSEADEKISFGQGETINQDYEETNLIIGQLIASVSVRYIKPEDGL